MKLFIAICAVLLLQACAFTDATLDVHHSKDANFNGPLSEVQKNSFQLDKLDDKRTDRARIGHKKNGYGQNTADISTTMPVVNIVQDAISAGLTANGHSVAADGRVKVSGDLEKFWFETDMNFWTVEFIGDVQCSLTFTDSLTNNIIYSATYKGTYSEKKAGGLEATWTQIMNKALDKLIEDVVYDEELAEALDSIE